MPLKLSVALAEPVAVTPEPLKPLAVKVPLEIDTTTVRADKLASVPVPRASEAKVILPLPVDTVIAEGRFNVGKLTATALAVAVLTATLLAVPLPPVMPLL